MNRYFYSNYLPNETVNVYIFFSVSEIKHVLKTSILQLSKLGVDGMVVNG